MTRILLLYATREGQTRKIARRIASLLREARQNVELICADDQEATAKLNLSDFDRLVFGASMHAGGLEQEIVQFINSREKEINESRRSLFLVLLSAATKDAAIRERSLKDARQKVNDQLRVTFDEMEMIAGALMYSKYSWPLKWLMKRIAKQAGEGTDTSRDYEYTDWQQVEQYAKRLV